MSLSEILGYILMFFVSVLWVCIIIKAIKHKCSKTVTVRAVVADKYKGRSLSKANMVFSREQYTVVFLADNKKLSFNVSEFSYNNYRIKDEGLLRYKGNKIIEFN